MLVAKCYVALARDGLTSKPRFTRIREQVQPYPQANSSPPVSDFTCTHEHIHSYLWNYSSALASMFFWSREQKVSLVCDNWLIQERLP